METENINCKIFEYDEQQQENTKLDSSHTCGSQEPVGSDIARHWALD